MALPDILFYLFAFLTLACGALVVGNPFSQKAEEGKRQENFPVKA